MLGRKLMVMGMSVILTAMLFAVPASAHGHHSHGHHRTERSGCAVSADKGAAVSCPVHVYGAVNGNCAVCPVDGCVQAGHHLHEDTVYCGYPHACGYCDGTCIEEVIP